jgi:hypothetical protein
MEHLYIRHNALTLLYNENTFPLCRSGETGRRRGLKIPRGQPHAGSIPASGTSFPKAIGLQSLDADIF